MTRFRVRVRDALDVLRGRAHVGIPWLGHVTPGADFSREVNFTRNETAFRLFLVAKNELLHELDADTAAKWLGDSAQTQIEEQVQRLYATLGRA